MTDDALVESVVAATTPAHIPAAWLLGTPQQVARRKAPGRPRLSRLPRAGRAAPTHTNLGVPTANRAAAAPVFSDTARMPILEDTSVWVCLAQAPALPLHTAGPYVFAAYIVFVALILVYVAIMAVRAQRTQRELDELRRDVEAVKAARELEDDDDPDGSGQPGSRSERSEQIA